MDLIAAKGFEWARVPVLSGAGRPAYIDPLDGDDPGDDVVVTTRRAICRVALVASETAGRFQREALPYDPMSWMLSPLRLFEGSTALDACLGRDACLRGILIHGLAIGLDAEPEFIDGLAADEDDDVADDADQLETMPAAEADVAGLGNVVPYAQIGEGRLRLFTATIVSNDGFESVQAFHASLATEEAEVAGRLFCRLGAAAADARIVAGFDPTDPLVAALVSDVMCDTLALIAAEPESQLASGLDVNIEQRFFD